MENGVIILLLGGIIGGAVRYIVKTKKRGQGCVGCPHSGACAKCRGK